MLQDPRWSWATYSRRERLGLLVLAVLMVAVFLSRPLWRATMPAGEPDPDFRARAAQLAEARTDARAGKSYSKGYGKGSGGKENSTAESFPFNPNTVTQSELVRLGLSERGAAGWVKYRKAGGRFDRPDQLARFRNIPDRHRERLMSLATFDSPGRSGGGSGSYANDTPVESFPYDPNTVTAAELVRLGLSERGAAGWVKYRKAGGRFDRPDQLARFRNIPDRHRERLLGLATYSQAAPGDGDSSAIAAAPRTYDSYPARPADPDFVIDINSASAAEWQQLRGIGPYWAGRFVKFRESMGGFVSTDQIGEIYGLPDSVFQKIAGQLAIESPIPSPLPINAATIDELRAHPYISRKLARVLVAYREEHGPYTGPEDMSQIRMLSANKLAKLMPYLSFEQ